MPDSVRVIAPGILFYSTPSHGGYWVHPDVRATWPAKLQAFVPFNGHIGWYEEDSDWAIVCLAHPDLFADHPGAMEAARATMAYFHPEVLAIPTPAISDNLNQPL